ncbi:MAG: hypothetical protein K2X03_17220 [Bryobacteraceae bacterium]|nr:hypothetical protein [Bryobacteraceae bacterium]
MKPLALAAGLAMPGAAHWLTGQRGKAIVYAGMVLTLVTAGVLLQGSTAMPGEAELAGLDGTSRLMFWGGAALKSFAGLPYFALSLGGYAPTFLAGLANEYGTKLLTMAGLVNVLALADIIEGKEKK